MVRTLKENEKDLNNKKNIEQRSKKSKAKPTQNNQIEENTDILDLTDLIEKEEPQEFVDYDDNVEENQKPKQLNVIETLKQKKVINAEPVVENKNEEKIEKKSFFKRFKKNKNEEPSVKKDYPRYYNTPVLNGLSDEIIEERKTLGLVNKANDDKGKTILGIILSNFFTFFNMLYLIITIIFILLRSYHNLLFLTTIIPNLLIGIYQEIKAKLMMDKLSLMSAPTTTVVRNGEKIDIPVEEIVLDDIVFFTPGKQISADSIVVEGFIEVNESLLTGEADPIQKNVGDQLLSGSFVVSGVAVARVDKVGKDNYIEKLSSNAKKYQKPKSELLRTLNGIIKIVSLIILPLAILTYISSLPRTDFTKDFFFGLLHEDSLIRAASSILAMIPAGLFLLTSMALFVGVRRLGKSKTLVQELYCIEMLARVNVLCLDKTGTITDGTMRVCDCIEVKNYTDYTIREIIGSMMNAFQDTNPTSDALIKYFDKNKVLSATDVIPFSSKRKYSAVTFGRQGTFILGAPEFVLMEHYDKVVTKVERFSAQGCRVLVLGHTPYRVKDELPKSVKPICLIVIQDHIRDDAADTIDYFKQNGVDIKVISGDNPITVSEIAQRAGIENAERYISLANLTDDEVREVVFDYTVFGRVSPNQKKIIVQTLKEHKKTVAMTGDGVNDILALKEADCSIAMASGSEATRYVSHLVLMDSNFSSMPKVVGEGRRVINNIQKTSTLYLSKTMFSILLTIMYIILGVQKGAISISYPFDARNLYMIEWFALGIPSFFLALQPNRELVKGKFISNVIKTTLPGALTVVILHMLLATIRIIPGFDSLQGNQAVYTTIATIVTTFVMMMVLLQVSQPFNWLRRSIYFLMVIACLVASFGLISFMKLDLNFKRDVNEYPINLTVSDNGYWKLDDKETPIRAVKQPDLNILFEENYLTPVISINKYNFWCLNGVATSVYVIENETLNLRVSGTKTKYWELNGVITSVEAVRKPEVSYLNADGYKKPVLTIDKGYWSLDGLSTSIVAKNENKIELSVENGHWWLNTKETTIQARFEIINDNEYIIPTVVIETKNGERVFRINDYLTDILADDGGDITLVVDENGYWNLNGFTTELKALKIVDTIDEEYVAPTITISTGGYWYLNDTSTNIPVNNYLLITEILITVLLVQLVYPLMWLVSSLLKKLRVIYT